MSDSNPLISVILPTYNRELTLGRAIDSVLSQTHRNLELIVVDDASTDNTRQLVAAIDDERIRYLRLDRNQGAHAARNIGIGEARGDYIGFQDSDDEWLPDFLSVHLKSFASCQHAGVSVVSGVRVATDGSRRPIPKKSRRLPDGCTNLTQELLGGSFFSTPLMLIKRNLLIDAGLFYEGRTHLMEDWELAIRLSRKALFSISGEAVHIAYIGSDNISSVSAKDQADAIASIVDLHRATFATHADRLILQHVIIAGNYLGAGCHGDAGRHLKAAFRLAAVNPVAFARAGYTLLRRKILDALS